MDLHGHDPRLLPSLLRREYATHVLTNLLHLRHHDDARYLLGLDAGVLYAGSTRGVWVQSVDC